MASGVGKKFLTGRIRKGLLLAKPGSDGQVYTTSSYEQTHDFVGIVLAYDADAKRAYIEQRNNVKNGEGIGTADAGRGTVPANFRGYA